MKIIELVIIHLRDTVSGDQEIKYVYDDNWSFSDIKESLQEYKIAKKSNKSIEYGKIPAKKVKVGFRVAMATQPFQWLTDLWNRAARKLKCLTSVKKCFNLRFIHLNTDNSLFNIRLNLFAAMSDTLRWV